MGKGGKKKPSFFVFVTESQGNKLYKDSSVALPSTGRVCGLGSEPPEGTCCPGEQGPGLALGEGMNAELRGAVGPTACNSPPHCLSPVLARAGLGGTR